ncbi:MAG: hypothetical protein IJX99_04630 [Clostridia bacterium]|nr:hypothetical protein [Clostridia bacterium]
MDNISKALVMAGGVLISIAVISIAVSAFSSASNLAKAAEQNMSASQISSFNRFYTAYQTTYTGPTTIRCIDAVNILNRAIEDDVSVSNSSSLITRMGDYYVADSANYTTRTVKYSLSFIDGVGKVSRVTITD